MSTDYYRCFVLIGSTFSVIFVDADCEHCVSGVRCDDVAGCSQCLGYNDPPYCTEGNN